MYRGNHLILSGKSLRSCRDFAQECFCFGGKRRGDWLWSRVGTSLAASPLANFLAGCEVKNMAALLPNTARLRIPPAAQAVDITLHIIREKWVWERG